jgi:hypothetical protein
MTNILSLDQKNDHFGDVRSVVSDSFEVSRHEYQSQSPRHGAGVFQHVGQQFTQHLLANVVDVPVAFDNAFRQFRVEIYEGIKAIFQDPLGGACGDGYIDDGLQLRLVDDFLTAPRDIDAVVTDPLDITDNLHGCGDEAEIGCDRLLPRKDFQAQFVDFELQAIDLVVPVDNPLRKGWTSLHEGARAVGDRDLDFVADQKQLVLQGAELLVVLFAGVFTFRFRHDVGIKFVVHFKIVNI